LEGLRLEGVAIDLVGEEVAVAVLVHGALEGIALPPEDVVAVNAVALLWGRRNMLDHAVCKGKIGKGKGWVGRGEVVEGGRRPGGTYSLVAKRPHERLGAISGPLVLVVEGAGVPVTVD